MTKEDEGLARESAAPFHEQLSTLLRQAARRLAPGSRMPTEAELVAQYRVSRSTVRRALETLVEEGVLTRRQGKGTFVRPNRIVHPLDQLRPFVTIFTEVGQNPGSELLGHEWVTDAGQLPDPIAAVCEEALHVRRLYRMEMGQVPVAIADIFVPRQLGLQITRSDLEEHPVYQVIQQKLGRHPDHADIAARSLAAPAHLARPLEMPAGSPLLVLERTTFDSEQQLLECTTHYMRQDTFELRLRVDALQSPGIAYNFPHPTSPRLVLIKASQRGPRADPSSELL